MISPDSPAYDWFGLNRALFLLVNDVRSPLVDAAMVPFSVLGHPRLYPLYVAIAAWYSWRHPARLPTRNLVAFTMGYLIVSVMIVPALKGALDFPRPLTVFGPEIAVIGPHDAAHSFPSGHAAFAVLTACALAPGTTRAVRAALTVFAVLVCVSRVSVGAHFPADVVAGALVAALVTTCLQWAMRSRSTRTGNTP